MASRCVPFIPIKAKWPPQRTTKPATRSAAVVVCLVLALPVSVLGQAKPALPPYFGAVAIEDRHLDQATVIAFEEHAAFVYLVATVPPAASHSTNEAEQEAGRMLRRCLLLKPSTLIIDDTVRNGRSSGRRTVHQLALSSNGSASATESQEIEIGELKRITIEAGQYKYQVLLPPADQAAGYLAITKDGGESVLRHRIMTSGVLPYGSEGQKMLERWDSAYRTPGRAPWDTGRASKQLTHVVESGQLQPCRAVVLGCGTGTNAIYLAQQGFKVTGVDIAPTALSLAAKKAKQANVDVRWVLADVTAPPELGPFDFVFDRGCYHGVRQQNAPGYVSAVTRLTRSGAKVLIMAGNAKDTRAGGPPKVTEEQIRNDFQSAFIVESLRETRFGNRDATAEGALAWAIVLRRKGADVHQDVLEKGFVDLFPENGVPKGWVVRQWNDLREPAGDGVNWIVRDGVLHGSNPRGTWLVSEKQYADFILKFEFKLGERGNSGCAIRSPMYGDPAFDGMELQMADLRYNTQAKDSELTGGIYRAIAPKQQVYKPTAWNQYEITLRGSQLKARLNGVEIHNLNLDKQDQLVERHDGSDAPAIKDRPRRGHIGFQELSRGGSQVQIRNAQIRVLNEQPDTND
jgi:SAM-dependent methyltransferase